MRVMMRHRWKLKIWCRNHKFTILNMLRSVLKWMSKPYASWPWLDLMHSRHSEVQEEVLSRSNSFKQMRSKTQLRALGLGNATTLYPVVWWLDYRIVEWGTQLAVECILSVIHTHQKTSSYETDSPPMLLHLLLGWSDHELVAVHFSQCLKSHPS